MNSTGRFIAVALVVLALAVAGVVVFINMDKNSSDSVKENTSNTTAEASVETNTVMIQNHAYSPAHIKVKKGTTVTWTNQDAVEHDITPDNPSDKFARSELLGRGDSYSVTFDEVGTYTYFCTPHPEMTGSVEVIE